MTGFKEILRPIVFLSKIVGVIHFSYTMESTTGYLIRNTKSWCCYFLELTQISGFLLCTYYVSNSPFYTQRILIYKLWFIMFTARLSEVWIIKLINGIIEFDGKLADLSGFSSVRRRSPCRKIWVVTFALSFAYYATQASMIMYFWPPRYPMRDLVWIVYNLFVDPFFVDFALFISTRFYLSSLECRFRTLTDFWEHLPAGLAAVPGRWTGAEIATSMEDVRMLHAELSELLKTFSVAYGPLILAFFASSFSNMLYSFYFIIFIKTSLPATGVVENILRSLPPHMVYAQNFVIMASTLAVASRINEMKKKIIPYLRSYQISKLQSDVKLQVKMFMNQISIFESVEMSAFGLFNVDLNLVVSILVLLITGLTTLIQMKNHSIILNFTNDTTYLANKTMKTFNT